MKSVHDKIAKPRLLRTCYIICYGRRGLYINQKQNNLMQNTFQRHNVPKPAYKNLAQHLFNFLKQNINIQNSILFNPEILSERGGAMKHSFHCSYKNINVQCGLSFTLFLESAVSTIIVNTPYVVHLIFILTC